MPITKRGVYHNLKESKYAVSNNDIAFFFSSEHTRKKFMDRYKIGREIFNQKMKSLADTKLNFDTLADINTYKVTEMRGYYVWLMGVSISWDELNGYALRKMTDNDSPKWFITERPALGERFRIME